MSSSTQERSRDPTVETPHYELIRFATSEALARAAAGKWLSQIGNVEARPAPYCVALSGGRIARQFFSAVATLARNQGAELQSIHFFWGDERCVPPTDAESNFGVANELLLRPLAIPEIQIHRIRGEAPPEMAAAEAEADLKRLAPASEGGQPVLDQVFLGLGEEGHVASLFPGEPEQVVNSPAVFRAVVAAKPPPRRITLGYPALAAARQVWVLASGSGKESALGDSLSPGGRTPLGRLLMQRAHTKVFSDIAFAPDRRG